MITFNVAPLSGVMATDDEPSPANTLRYYMRERMHYVIIM